MKELDSKETPEVGGGSVSPTLPGGPIMTPTYPTPEFPQYPITPVLEPVTGKQKV